MKEIRIANPFELIYVRLTNIEALLLDQKREPSKRETASDQETYLTVAEAAKFLKLTVPTVYAMIHSKRIPFNKNAKRVYFLKDDLVEYLNRGRQKTA